jgi:hypothetical protein
VVKSAEAQTENEVRQAKSRLEQICKLLGNAQTDVKLRINNQEALAAVFEEIVFA